MQLLDRVHKHRVRVGIVGLGYVGLPLAVEFGRQFETVGYDLNAARIDALRSGRDDTRETTRAELAAAARLTFSSDAEALRGCDVFIVTVPTPVDASRRPDLTPLTAATRTVGSLLTSGATVIYESTVYPGCTEEVCVPILEQASGLTFNEGFFCGYSPERINPGDRAHRLPDILKVTSGSTPEVAAAVDALYAAIIRAGTYPAPSIRVAEAAKVIENTQRDINIAFVNELAMIFHALNIDTHSVLEAAGTKWNFLPFRPGLVGGHCIGVDPYYLAHKAESVGYHPQILLTGRRLNDNMGRYAAARLIKLMIRKGQAVRHSRVLVLGITFKENCPDIRNSRVIDLVRELQDFGCVVDVHDPWADPAAVEREYGLSLAPLPDDGTSHPYDGVVLAVAHDHFGALDIRSLVGAQGAIFDLKGFLPRDSVDDRL